MLSSIKARGGAAIIAGGKIQCISSLLARRDKERCSANLIHFLARKGWLPASVGAVSGLSALRWESRPRHQKPKFAPSTITRQRCSIVGAQFLQVVAFQSRLQNAVPYGLDVRRRELSVIGPEMENEIVRGGDVPARRRPGVDCESVQSRIDRPPSCIDLDVRRLLRSLVNGRECVGQSFRIALKGEVHDVIGQVLCKAGEVVFDGLLHDHGPKSHMLIVAGDSPRNGFFFPFHCRPPSLRNRRRVRDLIASSGCGVWRGAFILRKPRPSFSTEPASNQMKVRLGFKEGRPNRPPHHQVATKSRPEPCAPSISGENFFAEGAPVPPRIAGHSPQLAKNLFASYLQWYQALSTIDACGRPRGTRCSAGPFSSRRSVFGQSTHARAPAEPARFHMSLPLPPRAPAALPQT